VTTEPKPMGPARLPATFDTCHREGETYTMGVGRARERADVLDFIRHPPGRIPDGQCASLAELANAIDRGQHSGGGERLYEDLPWLRDGFNAAAVEMTKLRAEVARLRARVRVEAEDVERAGVTWAHVEACLKRSDPEVDIARLCRLWGAGIERLIDQIARNESVSTWDILDEMAAMGTEPTR
jgi:hypothetical protein